MSFLPRDKIGSSRHWVTDRLRRWIIDTIATHDKFGIDYDAPVGDVGLFGPHSVTWKIHADFPGMMIGGIAALMLQALHPRALAGIWDHSRFRQDPLGRLRNTTTFVAATSYAPVADAERMIARVDDIHGHVKGQTPDGQPYDARDPVLLTWVHCTEAAMFLEGYKRFRRARLTPVVEDRYFDEVRRIAQRLGATGVPDSRARMAEYFADMQPQLRFDERSRATLSVLADMEVPVPMAALSRRTFIGAAVDLLPDWARQMMSYSLRQRWSHHVSTGIMQQAAPLMQKAMSDGIAMRAARRCGHGREAVEFGPLDETFREDHD